MRSWAWAPVEVEDPYSINWCRKNLFSVTQVKGHPDTKAKQAERGG